MQVGDCLCAVAICVHSLWLCLQLWPTPNCGQQARADNLLFAEPPQQKRCVILRRNPRLGVGFSHATCRLTDLLTGV